MKRILYCISTAFALTFTFAGYSQSYDLTVTNSPYADLTNGTSLVSFEWSDLEFTVPIGFEFEYFGKTVDSLYSFDFFAGEFFGTSPNQSAMDLILAFSTDLIDRGFNIDSSLSPVTYETEGEQGHRVFTLEFESAGFQNGLLNSDNIYYDFINFQLKLYEENNNISVHIGSFSTANPAKDFEGLSGPSMGLIEGFNFSNGSNSGEVFLLSGDPLNPTIHTDFADAGSFIWPIPENTVYTFSPKPTSNKDHLALSEESYFFPNPTSGRVFLSEIAVNIVSPIKIFNALGELVRIENNVELLDLTGLMDGIYMLSFQTTSGIAVQKISLIK